MKNVKIAGFVLMVAAVILLGFSVVSFADTTILTADHAPYFHSGPNPIASIFYFLGDVVMLPFRLIGNLFS